MKSSHALTLASVTLCTAGLVFLFPAASIAMRSGFNVAEPSAVAPRTASVSVERSAVQPSAPAPVGVATTAAERSADLAIVPRRTHPAPDAIYETTNPTHGLHAGFTSRGIRVRSGDGSAELVLELAGIGYGTRLQGVTEGALFAREERIDYYRTTTGGAAFTEWYLNEPDGLEQSFTFDAPVGERRGGSPLVIELAFSGDFAGTLDEAGGAIDFATRDGAHTLRYDGLYAFDACHRELPSWMELDGGRLRLLVDDSQATYPVTVDPKTTGGGRTSQHSAEADIDDDPGNAIRSDGGGSGAVDYSDGVDNVECRLDLVRMNVRGNGAGRTASFDFGAARRIPRDASHQYYLTEGTQPAGTDISTGVFVNSVQINSWGTQAYVEDPTSPSGWSATTGVYIPDMAILETAYMAFNVTLVDDGNQPVWRLFFGSGNVGPFRAQDSQPLKVTRVSATTWEVKAIDHGNGHGLRAALTSRDASTNTFEVVDFYRLPFRMTLTLK